jgi:dTDP-4-amino-4,6-dideoxygalactose transaminase
VNGPAVKEFEHNWAQYCGTKHAVGLSNGTNALILALEAMHDVYVHNQVTRGSVDNWITIADWKGALCKC